MTRFAPIFTNLFQGDLGLDIRKRPVAPNLLIGLRRSFELLMVSFGVALPLGLLWGGLLATVRRGVWGALVFGLSTLLISLPSFMVLLLAIQVVATITWRTGVQLALVQGYGLDKHLILPVAVLALRGAAFMARAIQVAQEDILRQDWIRAARAKGLGGFLLWRRHILPALRLPVFASALGMVRVLISGIIIVDYVYNWGGIGSKMLRVTQDGRVTGANVYIVAGGAVLLFLFFVLIDTVGDLVMRNTGVGLQEGAYER